MGCLQCGWELGADVGECARCGALTEVRPAESDAEQGGHEDAAVETVKGGRDRKVRLPRHTVDRSGTTHTYRLHRGRNRALGIICLAIAASFPVGLWAEVTSGQLDVWDVILFIGMMLFFLWGGICAFRKGVQVSAGKLAIRNELSTRTVNASEIRAITLQPKAVSQIATHWVACVELTNGSTIWMENFDCGAVGRPPRPEMAAIVDEVRALLGVRTNESGS